jgi:hypothetical protein
MLDRNGSFTQIKKLLKLPGTAQSALEDAKRQERSSAVLSRKTYSPRTMASGLSFQSCIAEGVGKAIIAIAPIAIVFAIEGDAGFRHQSLLLIRRFF